MGTGESHSYPSLARSARGGESISFPASSLIHASIGEYTQNSNRLKSGCHSQAGLEELRRRGIKFEIEKTYRNGVRAGRVPQHYQKMKRKSCGQLWFPKDWTSADIRKAARAVLLENPSLTKGEGMATGWYNNVKVGIIVRNGQIKTIFPTKEQE